MTDSYTRLFMTWLALVALTVGSFGIATMHDTGPGFVLVMAAAAIKGRLVVREFMAVRLAPRVWRIIFDVQLGLAFALITGLHTLGALGMRA